LASSQPSDGTPILIPCFLSNKAGLDIASWTGLKIENLVENK